MRVSLLTPSMLRRRSMCAEMVIVTGGVFGDVLKRVVRDTTRSNETPASSLQMIAESVLPMYFLHQVNLMVC